MKQILSDKRMLFILATTLLNFLGFSIIIPIIPFLVQQYLPHHSSMLAFYVGVLMATYALCQFISAPGLGMLSDRFGRRPVLLLSLFGSVLGYLVLAMGGSLGILFLGRIIDGLTGGNISTVYAYVADITEPRERGRFFGLLGAAGGIGFMLGPAIGGIAATINLTTPLYLAAGVTLLNIIWGYFILPESLKKEHRLESFELSHLNPFGQFGHLLAIPVIRVLFGMVFLFFFASTLLQGNFSVFLKDVYQWGPSNVGGLLFMVGIVDIFTQGFLTSKLLPILGDVKLGVIGLLLNGVGLFAVGLTAFSPSLSLLLLAVILLNIGDGLVQPSFSGLISKSVEPRMQGRVQGANQGVQSISRVLGPLAAAGVYHYGRSFPYFLSALVIGLTLIFFFFSLRIIHSHEYQQ